MKELTRAEEQVMQILWDLKKGFVNDVLLRMPDPKPAYNTVSTIIRILEQKGFVSHKAYGRTHEYFPLLTKKQYTKTFLKRFVANYFDNSYPSLATFFSRDEQLTINELEEIKFMMEQAIQQRKTTDL